MCNLSQVATGARYLKGVNRVLLKSNMCSIWGATETTSQQRADEANSDEMAQAGIFYCNAWNKFDNCPIKIPSLEGIISYSQASIARRKPGRRYLKSAFIRDIQLMNDSPVSWSRHSPGSWREGEREWTILRSFPVFELILYLQGRHEYSSKHSSSLFNKRYLRQQTQHSCFNCSIRVEMNRQQLLGVAREVQSFSSPSSSNR